MHRLLNINVLSTLFCLISSTCAFSQQTFNAAGHSATINGMRFDYSIGEMTLVSTERNGNLIVTQGLLQPTGGVSMAQQNPGNSPSGLVNELVKVYPNPTQNILFVESNDLKDADISYTLYDATGKTVMSNSMFQKAGINKFSLDLQNLAAGSYYLMVRKPGISGEMENFSYKIQKTN